MVPFVVDVSVVPVKTPSMYLLNRELLASEEPFTLVIAILDSCAAMIARNALSAEEHIIAAVQSCPNNDREDPLEGLMLDLNHIMKLVPGGRISP